MKNNKILTILVIILAIGLLVQSAYLWKIKSENKSTKRESYESRKADRQRNLRTERTQNQHQLNNTLSSAGSFDPFAFSFQSSFDQYDPFQEMEQIQQRMNRMFRDSFSRAVSFDDSGFLNQHARMAFWLLKLQK